MKYQIMTGQMCQPDVEAMEAVRERLGLSKAELCRRMGVRPQAYNGYLRGEPIPVSVQRGVAQMIHGGA